MLITLINASAYATATFSGALAFLILWDGRALRSLYGGVSASMTRTAYAIPCGASAHQCCLTVAMCYRVRFPDRARSFSPQWSEAASALSTAVCRRHQPRG